MRYFLVVPVMVSVSACNILSTDVQRGYQPGAGWSTAATYTTADVRIVTQRTQPVLGNQIVCTEPSPDVAKALSTAEALSAKGGNYGAFGASGSSAEAVAELAGRSTALLGLRDGLYRACEAYANGVLGQDAYALVLSRYGQLMTTLFLGQDITDAAGVAAKAASVISPALQPVGDQSQPSAGPTSTTAPKTRNANDIGGSTPKFVRAAVDATTPSPRVLLAAAPPAAPPGPASPQAAKAPTGSSPNPQQGPTAGSPPKTDSAAGVSAGAALALTRMNEDYIN
jgi:hypothetical protein